MAVMMYLKAYPWVAGQHLRLQVGRMKATQSANAKLERDLQIVINSTVTIQ